MKKNTYSHISKPVLVIGKRFLLSVSVFLLVIVLTSCSMRTGRGTLTLATTTSVDDSGLLMYLKPEFEKDTGITLEIIAQGTGQAIKTGENGDADVLLVHSKKAEDEFVSNGHGLKRIELMYNYFVIVGPKNNPAGITNNLDAAAALKRIMESKSPFISRGDDSGTHKKEVSLWEKLKATPSGDWYISAGKGMGAVLSMANEKQAYTLTDKATYLSMRDKLDLQIVVDAAPDLKNQYTIIAVNPEKHDGINKEGAQKFIEWMTSEKALNMINEFGKDKYRESLFIVNYSKNN
ncbi:MAG: extracellular solute-binding protein family 1 [Clostridia bacterium]|uniref:extracellular solute-binding protein n=1 Tax=Petroclostridium xylanilyticum TaxID=1792311 RepID=UPI000B980F68|nr:extracellular solute-binding protein [Petroclostridium xylanilyticum]MBZ4646009.1 extracellular solute-binding protein family 1 [Clostridia bacterium]